MVWTPLQVKLLAAQLVLAMIDPAIGQVFGLFHVI
jgi:hypothetical protein